MNRHTPVVLVVEADATARRMLDVRLRGVGCQVAMASTGSEAIAAIMHMTPSVILLSIQMPDMDGMELLRGLHRNSPEASIVAMSAAGGPASGEEVMKEGAVNFFEKPFALEDMENVVRNVLKPLSA